jgi:hypothetical protein
LELNGLEAVVWDRYADDRCAENVEMVARMSEATSGADELDTLAT